MTSLFEALETTADGAFVINEDLEIVYWNRAAQDILGFAPNQVVGQLCHQVLQGQDEYHRLICRLRCRVARTAFRGEPIVNYDVRVRTASGDARWLNMSMITFTETREDEELRFVFHIFRDISQKRVDERLWQSVLEAARRHDEIPLESAADRPSPPTLESLTPREREVLARLARGHGTADIARLLSISPSTVRNHIQHILQKLQVHSRLEAVSLLINHERSE